MVNKEVSGNRGKQGRDPPQRQLGSRPAILSLLSTGNSYTVQVRMLLLWSRPQIKGGAVLANSGQKGDLVGGRGPPQAAGENPPKGAPRAKICNCSRNLITMKYCKIVIFIRAALRGT